ncbi:CaiB/BaiF CoA transferase family protein [Chloroflexota bacterium]
MAGPLEGIVILDWTQFQMGPVATSMLADLGANVIHIEDRIRGDGGRGMTTIGGTKSLSHGKAAYFEIFNRGKKSLTLDLRQEKGKEAVYRLTKKADVFVHNYRQGVPERLGLGYETLRQYNPKLIYIAGSGYGPEGPEAMEPAFDPMGLARSGIMTQAGEPDMPPQKIERGISDQMGGVVMGYGILVALLAREWQGVGQKVDVSQISAMMCLQASAVGLRLYTGAELARTSRKKAANPLWNYYPCQDGKWLMLAMLQSDRYWPTMCKALGMEHLEKVPKFEDMGKRQENCEELISIMDEIFLTKSASEWVKVLRGTGDTICTPIQSTSDLLTDPQVLANDYIIDTNHKVLGPVKVANFPIQFSETPAEVKCEAPEFSEHTEEVLIEIGGYSWEEIAQLRDEEVL